MYNYELADALNGLANLSLTRQPLPASLLLDKFDGEE